MVGDNKWKNNLLASSFPLEYEVAKILASKNFAVSSDYTYKRVNEKGEDVDFSVDVYAVGYAPFNDFNKADSMLEMLVECKYRTPDAMWLFLEDPNIEDFSDGTYGYTIREIDNFSIKEFSGTSNYTIEEEFKICYKCVEIKGDRVYDNEFKHGIEQLRYGLPRLLKETIENNLYGHIDDNIPFSNCAILLTTADLYVANKDFSMGNLKSCSEIQEIAEKVPYLMFYSQYGPDFMRHCNNEFQELYNLLEDEGFSVFESRLELDRHDMYSSSLPGSIIEGLINGEKFYLNKHFTQFIISDYNHFEELIELIQEIIKKDTMSKL